MASCSQVSQNKRGMASCLQLVSQNKRARHDYWNGGFASSDAKRDISRRTLAYDSDLMSLLDKIDNMDNNESKPGTDTVNELEGEIGLNAVMKYLEEEIGLKAQAHNNIESTDEKGSNDQMGSIKEGELTECNFEATSSTRDAGGFKKHDDVGADLGFLTDCVSPDEFAIIVNYFDGESMTNIMYYSDAVYGYAEIVEHFYGSLCEDDIWQVNEHAVIQNDFASSQPVEFGIIEADDVWSDFRTI